MITDAIRFKNRTSYLSEDDQYIFSDLIGKGVYAYLDDLIICSKDGDTHLAKLQTVLFKLREAGMKIKLTKCEFL